MPLTPKRDSSAAAVSPPVAAKAPIAGATGCSASARPCASCGPSDMSGSIVHHDLDQRIAAGGQSLRHIGGERRASGASSPSSVSRRRPGNAPRCRSPPARAQPTRDAPASEPTTISVPDALGGNAQRLDVQLVGVEAGQRMRETGAADEEGRRRRMQARFGDQVQIVVGLGIADRDHVALGGATARTWP